MFITLTIDTHQAKNHKLRLHRKRFNAASGWRRKLHIKKRSLWQKFKDWRRSMKRIPYRLDGQVAMF